MAKVKGSKQDRLIVRRHRPFAVYAVQISLVFVALLVAAVSFYLGQEYQSRLYQVQPGERDQLQILTQEIASLKRDHLVDQLALEKSRTHIKELEEELHQQGKLVSFYKSVMKPQGNAQGLQVQRFYAAATGTPNEFDVSWVIAQVGKNDKEIAGISRLRILGLTNEQHTVLEMAEITGDTQKMAFKLRYFQALSLRLKLPVGFTAETIEIVAQSNQKKPQSVTRQFEWAVQEALVDAR